MIFSKWQMSRKHQLISPRTSIVPRCHLNMNHIGAITTAPLSIFYFSIWEIVLQTTFNINTHLPGNDVRFFSIYFCDLVVGMGFQRHPILLLSDTIFSQVRSLRYKWGLFFLCRLINLESLLDFSANIKKKAKRNLNTHTCTSKISILVLRNLINAGKQLLSWLQLWKEKMTFGESIIHIIHIKKWKYRLSTVIMYHSISRSTYEVLNQRCAILLEVEILHLPHNIHQILLTIILKTQIIHIIVSYVDVHSIVHT